MSTPGLASTAPGVGGTPDSNQQQQQQQQQQEQQEQQQQQQPQPQEQEAALRAALAEFQRRGLAATRNQQHPLNAGAAAAGEANPAAAAAAAGNNENEALAVRRNLFRASLGAIGSMNRVRRTLLAIRLLLSIAQIAVGITIVSLPSSHHDFFATAPNDPEPEICQPSAMLVFLSLHIVRVAINLPADVYLSISPHRSNRARRPGADGLEARERNRAIGNIYLDRRIAKVSDLIALAHVVLFIVGNYTLYSSSECAKPPARSVPLFWTTFSFLAIDYLSIIEVAILALAVIFFLPVVIFLLRLFGIADRLHQPEIHPEHKKISQETVDQIPLVFYRPADEEEEPGKDKPLEDAAAVPLPPSRAESPQPKAPTSPHLRTHTRDESTASTVRTRNSMTSVRSAASGSHPASTSAAIPGAVHRQGPLSRLFFARRSSRRSIGPPQPSSPPVESEGISLDTLGPSSTAAHNSKLDQDDDVIQPTSPSAGGMGAGYGRTHPLPHPLHSLPAHRATCPICLCDFEEPPDMELIKWEALERQRARESKAKEDEAGKKTEANKGEERQGAGQVGRGGGEGEEEAAAVAANAPGPSTSRTRFFKKPSKSKQSPSTPASPNPKATPPTAESDARLLADVDLASEALEPLRLMSCGHVLHRSCLDEWLTGVSGRCPVCSRPVLKPVEGAEDGDGAGVGMEAGTPRGEQAA